MLPRLSVGLATAALLLLAAHRTNASHPQENPALLGVVATDTDGGPVTVVRVLRESPAATIGVRPGDRLLSIDQTTLNSPRHLDQVLAQYQPGNSLILALARGGQPLHFPVVLVARNLVPEAALRRQRGMVGFPAPPWYGYAWDLPKGVPAPTRNNSRGKVVVIHAFQSW